MKNSFLTKFLTLTFALFILLSCETEKIDPALLNSLTIQNTDCISPTISSGVFSNSTSIILNWQSNAGTSSWQIQYGLKDFSLGNGTIVSSDNSTKIITNLSSTNSYDFWIRTVCGSQEFGSWIGPYTVSAPNANCSNPSGFTAVRNVNNTSATLNWTANGSETEWQINYVLAGSLISQGTIVSTTTKPFTINGLTNQAYDFYVRAKCSSIENSNWVGAVTIQEVTTNNNGIAGNYLFTNFNSSVPIDLNNDGTSSTNVLSETACYNNMHLILLPNNTFTQDSKGVDIDIVVENGIETETIACYDDPIETGTWALNGTTLTLSFTGTIETVTYNYNASNNTLTTTVNNGEIVGTTTDGAPITLTSNLTIIYTKQ